MIIKTYDIRANPKVTSSDLGKLSPSSEDASFIETVQKEMAKSKGILSNDEQEDFGNFFKDLNVEEMSSRDQVYLKTFYLSEMKKIEDKRKHHEEQNKRFAKDIKKVESSITGKKRAETVAPEVINEESDGKKGVHETIRINMTPTKVDIRAIRRVNAIRMKHLPTMPSAKPDHIKIPKKKPKKRNKNLTVAASAKVKNIQKVSIGKQENVGKTPSKEAVKKGEKVISGDEKTSVEIVKESDELLVSEDILSNQGNGQIRNFIWYLKDYFELKIFLIILGIVLIMIKYSYEMRKRKKLKEKSIAFQQVGYDYENPNVTNQSSGRGRVLEI